MYEAPLRDMQFVIEDVLGAPQTWRRCEAFEGLDAATAREVLSQAARFAEDLLAPINGSGDLEGCRLDDGRVTTPAGFRAAYRAFVDGGWPALAADPTIGGQGLPQLLGAALYEMLAAANHAWTMYPGLLHGACECLAAHGSPELKARYLGGLVSGETLSTMCLTEPQAGSDLAATLTRAVPGPAGDWRITGTKIFISGGDHDLTDNIIHLVLCRLPDAPGGSKGLSLMLVPKWLPDGSRNTVVCDGLEKKMGIKGSATCVMNFQGATGWLIGEPHRGLAAMFVMMNAARLHVGLQGLGHLERAQQAAHRHALERVQGRVDGAPAPIARHPAMRRLLWRLRALTEGQRVVAYRIAQLLDESHHHPDAAERARAEESVALLTPVAKAFLTDNGHRGADDALQAFGGYGYTHEFGIEQTVRDSRIAMVYEGTNEIQAIDLVQRKVLADGGQAMQRWLDTLADDAALGSDPRGLEFHAALQHQIASARRATSSLVDGATTDPEWPLQVAEDYLHGIGHTLLAWAWARTAAAIHAKTAIDGWLANKLSAARFGIEWLVPEAEVRWTRVQKGRSALAAINESR